MGLATAERRMAKRNDISVKVDVGVLDDCRIAASFRKVSLSEYISEHMRVIAKRDIDESYASRSAPKRPKPKS